MWVPISSTNTKRSASMRPSSSRHRLLKNSSRSSAPLVLFFGCARCARAYDRRWLRSPSLRTRPRGTRPSESGWPTAFFDIFYEQLRGLLVQLRSPARGFPGLEGAALVEELTVAFYGGTIDPKTAGCLGLGYALLYRLYDLLSEVQRISTHASTIPGAPSPQSAVILPHHL